MTPSDPLRVTDEAGVEFTLGTKIASGGQGTVYRVSGHPGYAIKLLTRPAELEQIERVRRLPLDGLSVAAPVTLVRQGGAGYVMRLANEMRPLREPYLPREFGALEDATWYAETGGLRRRLAIAANVARTLSGLHSRGLAFVDLNPNNVMVSEDLERDETWLIDTDNLTSMTVPRGNILGISGYIAPERIVRTAPASTLADAYSLAVLVFRMLVLTHPLKGQATYDLDGQEADRLINRGGVSYVADPDDVSNALMRGSLPEALFPLTVSGRLQQLFVRTFGPGRLAPTSRPGVARWRDVLFTALDNVVECTSGCGWTYFRLLPSCPSCGASRGDTLLITVYGGDLEQTYAARDTVILARANSTVIRARHLWGRFDDDPPVLTMRPDKRGIEVKTHGDAKLSDRHGKPVRALPFPGRGAVHRVVLEAPDGPARVLAIRSLGST